MCNVFIARRHSFCFFDREIFEEEENNNNSNDHHINNVEDEAILNIYL